MRLLSRRNTLWNNIFPFILPLKLFILQIDIKWKLFDQSLWNFDTKNVDQYSFRKNWFQINDHSVSTSLSKRLKDFFKRDWWLCIIRNFQLSSLSQSFVHISTKITLCYYRISYAVLVVSNQSWPRNNLHLPTFYI